MPARLEKREARREAKAEVAARLDKSIEQELLARLQSGTYNDIYNFPSRQYQKVLSGEEQEEEEDEEGEDADEEEELEEEEDADEQARGNVRAWVTATVCSFRGQLRLIRLRLTGPLRAANRAREQR